jgi:hypothetical protein
MARQVFYSFHYDNDCWRTQQVRNIGFIEGNKPVAANAWEQVKRGGDSAIENWITSQLSGRSCTVVLVGSETANRKWVQHEIVESWNARKGIVGIRVHNLKDSNGRQSTAGPNPFDKITVRKCEGTQIEEMTMKDVVFLGVTRRRGGLLIPRQGAPGYADMDGKKGPPPHLPRPP